MTTLQDPPRLLAVKKPKPAKPEPFDYSASKPMPLMPAPPSREALAARKAIEAKVAAWQREQWLAKIQKDARSSEDRMGRIVQSVCSVLRVDPFDLNGKCRHKGVVLAREIITVLAREMTTFSFPQIAAWLGRPNHSTVITARQRHFKKPDDKINIWDTTLTRVEWAKLCRDGVGLEVRP